MIHHCKRTNFVTHAARNRYFCIVSNLLHVLTSSADLAHIALRKMFSKYSLKIFNANEEC